MWRCVMPQRETIPESFETEVEKYYKILDETLEEIRRNLKINLPEFSRGFIIQMCEHCGCTETDNSGFCKRCGRKPQVLYP